MMTNFKKTLFAVTASIMAISALNSASAMDDDNLDWDMAAPKPSAAAQAILEEKEVLKAKHRSDETAIRNEWDKQEQRVRDETYRTCTQIRTEIEAEKTKDETLATLNSKISAFEASEKYMEIVRKAEERGRREYQKHLSAYHHPVDDGQEGVYRNIALGQAEYSFRQLEESEGMRPVYELRNEIEKGYKRKIDKQIRTAFEQKDRSIQEIAEHYKLLLDQAYKGFMSVNDALSAQLRELRLQRSL